MGEKEQQQKKREAKYVTTLPLSPSPITQEVPKQKSACPEFLYTLALMVRIICTLKNDDGYVPKHVHCSSTEDSKLCHSRTCLAEKGKIKIFLDKMTHVEIP